MAACIQNVPHTIVDIRPIEDYLKAHISGSVNIPLEDLADHLDAVRQMKNLLIVDWSQDSRMYSAHVLLKNNCVSHTLMNRIQDI